MDSFTSKKASEQINSGSVSFFCFFLVTVLFVLALVPILTSFAYHESPKLLLASLNNDSGGEKEPPEQSFVPVFAPSSVVIKPNATSQTVVFGKDDKTKVDSQFAVLLDAETGEILAGKQSDVQFSPASMTKVMTLIVACENLSAQDLERKIPFSEEIHKYVTTGEYTGLELGLPTITSSGINCIGDSYYIKDLLYGIGIKSAADCTYMVVKEICDNEQDFVSLMNQKAKEMGLTKTVFNNVVGFDSAGNQTTAEEMAVIMAYAMQSDLIADILTPRSASYGIRAYYTDVDGEERDYGVWFESTFASRKDKYKQFNLTTSCLDATKTGYTNESFIVCMATSKQTGRQYVLVLGNQKTDYTTLTEKFKATMIDIEFLCNEYIK